MRRECGLQRQQQAEAFNNVLDARLTICATAAAAVQLGSAVPAVCACAEAGAWSFGDGP